MTSPLKAIIWDMDGTIFDTERVVIDAWVEICEKHGYKNSREVLLQCIGRNMRESNDILRKNFGPNFDIEGLRAEKNDLVHAVYEKDGIPLKEGITDALAWIEAKGILNALASSSDYSKILSHLTSTDLQAYFSVIIGGDQITNGKPHPEIFLKAAEKLNVKPEQCIVFEDSRNGVLSASAAGMRVVMIPDLVPMTDDLAPKVHHPLSSGTEIIELLKSIMA